MGAVEERLSALGHAVPDVAPPVAVYVPAVQTGSLVYTSGQLPLVSGVLMGTAILGIPVSTTHTISGSSRGVGATKRLSAVRWGLGRKIAVAWVVTIPAAATISGLLFLAFVHLGWTG